jgi:hypothetical protein
VTEPTTRAGRALIADLDGIYECRFDVLAIEQEAVATDLGRCNCIKSQLTNLGHAFDPLPDQHERDCPRNPINRPQEAVAKYRRELREKVHSHIFDLPIGDDVSYSRGYSAAVATARAAVLALLGEPNDE